ncbi:hypothetical protein [Oryza sativa Japonica Group]|uniref:Vacuolar sorting receptor thioredoxin-like domain-containing protein n=1 Tax=Oryza sativa subsp. japonica TaxID=39947 RepID=Q5NB71_ORYSJ|nr:hypothetical protein [Oryza sativa Japonica Group]
MALVAAAAANQKQQKASIGRRAWRLLRLAVLWARKGSAVHSLCLFSNLRRAGVGLGVVGGGGRSERLRGVGCYDYIENDVLKTEQIVQVGHGARGDVTILPTLVINNMQYRGKNNQDSDQDHTELWLRSLFDQRFGVCFCLKQICFATTTMASRVSAAAWRTSASATAQWTSSSSSCPCRRPHPPGAPHAEAEPFTAPLRARRPRAAGGGKHRGAHGANGGVARGGAEHRVRVERSGELRRPEDAGAGDAADAAAEEEEDADDHREKQGTHRRCGGGGGGHRPPCSPACRHRRSAPLLHSASPAAAQHRSPPPVPFYPPR